MPFVFHRPVKFIRDDVAYYNLDDSASLITRKKGKIAAIKFSWPVKYVEPDYLFKKKPTDSMVNAYIAKIKFCRDMKWEMKCVCGKRWFPGTISAVTKDYCPGSRHKKPDTSFVVETDVNIETWESSYAVAKSVYSYN